VSRKGQVTIFIIVGIIILIVAVLLFFFRSEIFGAQIDLALEQDNAQGDALVVQEFVSACLRDLSIEALTLLGQQGGYINLSRTDVHNKAFSVMDNPTDGDAIQFNGLEIPYWWYEDSDHNCIQCSITTKNLPTMEMMEDQVSIYISERLFDCVGDFSSVEAQGFTVTEDSGLAVETEVGDDQVYVQLVYPLSIEKEGVTSQLENWYVEIPVPLQDMYEAAKEVMYMQIADQFLEQVALNIISAYSGIDDERLPPLAGFTEGYNVVFWVRALVQEQLQTYLNSYVPLIQIQGTNAAVPLEPETAFGTGFFTLLWRESVYSFDDIGVNFIYDDFDYYLDITPRSGELLKPSSYTQEFPLNILPPIQTNHYLFYYDVSFPIVVSLRDESALYGTGYTFLYGLEANVRDNRNLVQWAQGKGSFGVWDPSLVEVGLKEGVPTDYPSGINPETNETTYTETQVPPQTLMCDDEQRISGGVEISVYDGFTGDSITDAGIAFKCGIYQTCRMGTTDVSGDYEDNFPVCIGGVVRVDKTGYFTSFNGLSTEPDKEDHLIVLLEPIKEIPVKVRFIPTSRLGTGSSAMSLRSLAFDMDSVDSILLTLDKVPEDVYEEKYSQVASVTLQEESTLRLVSGTYEVNAIYMNEEGVIIPARNETVGTLLTGYEEIEYPEINMTPAMLGSVNLDLDSGYWEVDADDLHSAEEVTFYVFRMNDPYYIEDLAEMGNFSNYSKDYRDTVEPSWS
jgi:hypothetical protein